MYSIIAKGALCNYRYTMGHMIENKINVDPCSSYTVIVFVVVVVVTAVNCCYSMFSFSLVKVCIIYM